MIQFTDAEIGFVSMAIGKVDPTGITAEGVAIQQKIREYAATRAQEQATQAAAAEVATEEA